MSKSTDTNAYAAATLAARNQRILDHLPLVKLIARAFSNKTPNTVDPSDLVSAGTVGLIRAVDRFNAKRGSFEPFARRYIQGAILDYLRRQDPLPYSTRVRIRQIEQCMVHLQKSLNRMPTEQEVAEAMDLSVGKVSDLIAQAAGLAIWALDESRDTDLEECTFSGESERDALSGVERQEMKEFLARLIRELPRSERTILSLYYYEGLKMKEIGNLLGITESRVSQVHARALTMLRAQLWEMQEQRS